MFILAPFVLGVLAGFAVRYFGLAVPVATFVYVGLTVTYIERPANSWHFAIAAAAFSIIGVVVGARVRRGYDRMRQS